MSRDKKNCAAIVFVFMDQKEDLTSCRLNQYPSGKEDKLLKLFLGRQHYWWTQYSSMYFGGNEGFINQWLGIRLHFSRCCLSVIVCCVGGN